MGEWWLPGLCVICLPDVVGQQGGSRLIDDAQNLEACLHRSLPVSHRETLQ